MTFCSRRYGFIGSFFGPMLLNGLLYKPDNFTYSGYQPVVVEFRVKLDFH
jgi:hypothetical protein